MAEQVRLVIWDLDDTLWSGSLAEGTVIQDAGRQEIIRTLARRGIISAICSKNDLSVVRKILEEESLWDLFVFPSVNWEPKGPRIQGIIEWAQLRPASVLFIDDNPSNLEEARHFNPELQVRGVDFLPSMLDSPLLTGSHDPGLTRLRHYQILERRRSDQISTSGDVDSFLRQSDIRVSISYDISANIDRVIELVTRTNQLNFTKRRLPGGNDRVQSELRALLRSHDIQAGLLHVVDRYGDHGNVGFYMVRHGTELLHFCFSCRILGMGIETWLYRRLGRPRLDISGEVRSDPIRDSREIDWIHLSDRLTVQGPHSRERFHWVAARGGCDLQALSHYFRVTSPNVMGEFNVGRGGFDARIDHSIFLHYAVEGIPDACIQEAAHLGYCPEDFHSALVDTREGNGLIILSFWADVSYALYRHRRLGFDIPFALSGRSDHRTDARTARSEELPEAAREGWMAQALTCLQAQYDYLGPISEESFKKHLNELLGSLPPSAQVVLLLSNTRLRDPVAPVTHHSADNLRLNQWLTDVGSQHPRVHLVNVRDVIVSEDEVLDWSHFDRLVYYRLYESICRTVS